jgi:predicted GH43/DUF377 family glycosyl hydrolase
MIYIHSTIALLFLTLCPIWAIGDQYQDLEEDSQSFVVSTRQIHIPGYPNAFNPSIIRWKGKLLLSFRVIPNRKSSFDSEVGVVYVDSQFQSISKPQILKTNVLNPLIPSRAEDARLICLNDKLYMVYGNNKNEKITRGGFRVFISELLEENGSFVLGPTETLTDYEGENSNLREKNWSPFVYHNDLLLIYSIHPHVIFRPLFYSEACETFAKSSLLPDWKWGVLRGGTPAHLVGDEYLTFFHSCTMMASAHSGGKETLHYFMGAYTFSKEPPFEMRRISPEPIVGKDFYNGKQYVPYWHPVQAVFPGGFIMNDKYLWIVYGRQDHETWVVKIDKAAFFESLIPVNP